MPPSPRRARRQQRLSRSAEFDRVYRQGRSFGNRQLVLYAFPNADVQRPRVGLSVSRKVGDAVERNRVKRLLREAFARLEDHVQGGHDVVLVARPQALQLAQREGLDGIAGSLADLLVKAGLSERTVEAAREAPPDLSERTAAGRSGPPVREPHAPVEGESPGDGRPAAASGHDEALRGESDEQLA